MILLSDHALMQKKGGQSLVGGLNIEVSIWYWIFMGLMFICSAFVYQFSPVSLLGWCAPACRRKEGPYLVLELNGEAGYGDVLRLKCCHVLSSR